MRTVKLLIIASFAAMAFAAVGASVASAEEPAILCLVAGCHEFKLTATGGASELITLSNVGLTGETVESTIKECKEISGSGDKDINLCLGEIKFTGVKIKGTSSNCNSTGDATGVVLLKLDLHLGAEETLPGKVLEPVLLAKLLETLKLSCASGLIKSEVKGAIACLIEPGLTNIPTTENIALLCKINATTHDPETGMPDLLMEWLTEDPFLANLGSGFEDAWMAIHLEGKPNKDIFIDD